jgi:hypothetical protein
VRIPGSPLNSARPGDDTFGIRSISASLPEILQMPAQTSLPKMSNAAFAGFLRLLLTPLNETPRPSAELGAYLKYLGRAHREDR